MTSMQVLHLPTHRLCERQAVKISFIGNRSVFVFDLFSSGHGFVGLWAKDERVAKQCTIVGAEVIGFKAAFNALV